MTEREFERGQHVKYVPYHAKGDTRHPDCENGVVTSVRKVSPVNGEKMDPPIIFVRFSTGDTSQACYPDQLV